MSIPLRFLVEVFGLLDEVQCHITGHDPNSPGISVESHAGLLDPDCLVRYHCQRCGQTIYSFHWGDFSEPMQERLKKWAA